jgi:hypothetical protein
MRYIKIFEKWGIDKTLEELADKLISSIKAEPNTKRFTFDFDNGVSDIYTFNLIVKYLGPKTEGRFNYDGRWIYNEEHKTNTFDGEITIYLADRNDKSTLLHELKHFDRFIRRGKKGSGYYTGKDSILRAGLNWSDKIGNDFSPGIKSMFYLLNDDEFEAKYHGYYVDIDQYLEKNLIENPTKEDVINQINFYLKLPECDKSYSWWKNEVYLKFDKQADNKHIQKIFDLLINGEITPMIIPYTKIRELLSSVKTYIRMKFGIKTKLEKEQIKDLINQVEILINRNKEKYRKKFNKIYSIMVDKYVN